MVTTAQTRQILAEAFFFQPSVDVKRVLFIGTPHRGSSWARRPAGRLGSALVKPSAAAEARLRQVQRDNRNCSVMNSATGFRRASTCWSRAARSETRRHSLPYLLQVCVHSIIGTGKPSWWGEPSDGVVPVESARLVGVASEIEVDAKHEELHHNPTAIAEVIRILREHLRQGSTCSPGSPRQDLGSTADQGQR